MKGFYAYRTGGLVKIGDIVPRPDGSLLVNFHEPPPPHGLIFDPLEVTRPNPPPRSEDRFHVTTSYCPKCSNPVTRYGRNATGAGWTRHSLLCSGESCPWCAGHGPGV